MLPIGDTTPSRTWPVVNTSLIVINALAFAYQIGLGSAGFRLVTQAYGAIPLEVVTGRDLPPTIPFPVQVTLLTSMFLHGGVMHLLGNMLYLWIYGDNVEDAVGHLEYLLFYVTTGLVAGIAHIAFNLGSSIPAIGASGAISGVLGAYLVLYPHGRVRLLVFYLFIFRVVLVPAWIVLGFYFVMQALTAVYGQQGGVAVWAHVGGFVAGMVLIFFFRRRERVIQAWED